MRHNRRNIVVALVTFCFTLLTLLSLQAVSGVHWEQNSWSGQGQDALGAFGQQVTVEQQDYYQRASPLEQQRIQRERREDALTRGAQCNGKPC